MNVVFDNPVLPNGVIFADPLTVEIQVGRALAGAWPGEDPWRKVENEDEIIMAVIMKFLEVVDG